MQINLQQNLYREITFLSGITTLNGSMEKGLEFSGGELTLNGSVKASSTIAATRLRLGERAALSGPVRYWTETGEVNFGNALQDGATATFDPSLRIKYGSGRDDRFWCYSDPCRTF